MNTTDQCESTNDSPTTAASNYFVMDTGATMSIQAAVTMGLIYRGTAPGTIFTNNREMPADAAVAAGIIGADAAAYIASLPGTNVPAPHTREDRGYEPEQGEETISPSEASIAALGAFFLAPTEQGKAAAMEALEAHLKAAV
ncbi:MAG: hypothetical protein ACYCZJ_11900 [Sulfuriferula sp.]